MFIKIENTDKTLADIDRLIKKARDDNGGVISPEDAMELLKETNHYINIKVILNNIKEKCNTPEKIAPYREFILSCVDRREMSTDAMKMLEDMARLCGCKREYNYAFYGTKFYGVEDYQRSADVKNVKYGLNQSIGKGNEYL